MLVCDLKIIAILKKSLTLNLEGWTPRVGPADLAAVPSTKKENEGDGNGEKRGKKKREGEDGARREKGRENGTVIKWSPRLWKGPLAEWRQGWCYDCWQGRGHDCLRQRNPSYFRYQGHKTKANRPSTPPFKDISREFFSNGQRASKIRSSLKMRSSISRRIRVRMLIVGIFIIRNRWKELIYICM